ncbi:MAG: phospholipase A [Deltaproteobacteria bacterium]
MERRPTRYSSWAVAGSFLTGLLLVMVSVNMAWAQTPSATSHEIAECAAIEDNAERLKCYDRLAGREAKEPASALESGEEHRQEKENKFSYFSRLWELEPETRRDRFPISAYRSNYFLPYTYNTSPNYDAVRQADPTDDLTYEEVVFQLSFKVKLWSDVLGQNADLWMAYTQRSFWQLYDFEDSSPFRETNYEPELLLNLRTDYSLLGLKGRFINVGFNHQSNGQPEPLSRSWNRIVANAGFERGDFSLLLKGWYRIPESAEDDDNPQIEDYLGYGEVWAYYFWKGNRFGVMLRNNLDFDTNRGAVQLEWSFPLFERVSGYAQYFYGYGESLLDYNHAVNRIGIGFILKEWD